MREKYIYLSILVHYCISICNACRIYISVYIWFFIVYDSERRHKIHNLFLDLSVAFIFDFIFCRCSCCCPCSSYSRCIWEYVATRIHVRNIKKKTKKQNIQNQFKRNSQWAMSEEELMKRRIFRKKYKIWRVSNIDDHALVQQSMPE